jgi:hypothetical protein
MLLLAASPEQCLVHVKYHQPEGVHTAKLMDPQSHFSASHQNIAAVLREAKRLGIPRVLYRNSVQQRGARRHLMELIHGGSNIGGVLMDDIEGELRV